MALVVPLCYNLEYRINGGGGENNRGGGVGNGSI